MKAGVKEGDRIIKVSDLPSPPPEEGVQRHFWPWPSSTLPFSYQLSSATE